MLGLAMLTTTVVAVYGPKNGDPGICCKEKAKNQQKKQKAKTKPSVAPPAPRGQ